jgi:hypothetical protein
MIVDEQHDRAICDRMAAQNLTCTGHWHSHPMIGGTSLRQLAEPSETDRRGWQLLRAELAIPHFCGLLAICSNAGRGEVVLSPWSLRASSAGGSDVVELATLLS